MFLLIGHLTQAQISQKKKEKKHHIIFTAQRFDEKLHFGEKKQK